MYLLDVTDVMFVMSVLYVLYVMYEWYVSMYGVIVCSYPMNVYMYVCNAM